MTKFVVCSLHWIIDALSTTDTTPSSSNLADLVVLSDDYMTVDEDNISEIVSLLTMVDGQIIYTAAPFDQ